MRTGLVLVEWRFARCPVCLLHLLCVWMASFGLMTGIVSASETNRLRNCVDHCIVAFCTQAGNEITYDDLDAAVAVAGMDRSATYRSLADCIKLLDILGSPVEAQYLSVSPDAVFPPLSIVYLPSADPQKTGHAITVARRRGELLAIYDPSREPPRYSTKASEIQKNTETIMLVLKSYSRAMFVKSIALVFGGSIAIAGSLILGYLAIQRRRGNQGLKVNASSACIFLAVAFSAMQTGCNALSDSSEGQLDRFDFGVIDPEASKELVVHTFVMHNTGDKDLIVEPASTSCACVVAQLDPAKLRIEPGKSLDLPVTVQLKGKVGPFQERVLVKCKGGVLRDRILEVQGFVARKPFPSVTPFSLRALPGQASVQDLAVVYPRTNQLKPSKLARWTVQAASPETAAQFVVENPKLESGTISAGYFADLWTISIKFDNRALSPRTNAQLELDWDSPPGKTTIDLIGETLPPIELTSKAMYYECVAGQACVQSLPIRIYDPDRVASVKVSSDSPNVQAEILEGAKELRVTVRCDVPGNFQHRILLSLDESPMAEVEVFGNSKSGTSSAGTD